MVPARWRRVAAPADLPVDLGLPDAALTEAEPLLIGRLFDTLWDTACRYTPAGGSLGLAGKPLIPTGWVLSVSNTGEMIAPDVRGEIFERFRRGDPARQRETGGAGLGLALCQTIARLHGGIVRLDEPDGLTTRFSVELL